MSFEVLGLRAARLHRQRDLFCSLRKKSPKDLSYHLEGVDVETCNATNNMCVVQANKAYTIILGAHFKYMLRDGQVNVFALTHRSLIPFPGFKSFDRFDHFRVGGPCPLKPSHANRGDAGASFRFQLAFPNKGSFQ